MWGRRERSSGGGLVGFVLEHRDQLVAQVGLEQLALPERGYITAVRLLADGAWFAGATGINIPTPDERAVILAAAYELLSKVEA